MSPYSTLIDCDDTGACLLVVPSYFKLYCDENVGDVSL